MRYFCFKSIGTALSLLSFVSVAYSTIDFAERVGFEPTDPLRGLQISSLTQSANSAIFPIFFFVIMKQK